MVCWPFVICGFLILLFTVVCYGWWILGVFLFDGFAASFLVCGVLLSVIWMFVLISGFLVLGWLLGYCWCAVGWFGFCFPPGFLGFGFWWFGL